MPRLEQVFVGCPFQSSVRKNYDRLKLELEAQTPLRVVLADTASLTSTDDLLEHITALIRDSAACLFDATGANPNVSLEVGIAHALPTDFLLTISTRRPPVAGRARRGRRTTPDRPLIADLQGRNRIEYKTYRSLKDQVLRRYLAGLPYLRRWHEFEKNHRSHAPLALGVLHEIRASGRTTRPRLDAILSATGVSVTALTAALTRYRLVTVRSGRDGGYFYPSK